MMCHFLFTKYMFMDLGICISYFLFVSSMCFPSNLVISVLFSGPITLQHQLLLIMPYLVQLLLLVAYFAQILCSMLNQTTYTYPSTAYYQFVNFDSNCRSCESSIFGHVHVKLIKTRGEQSSVITEKLKSDWNWIPLDHAPHLFPASILTNFEK